MKLLSNMPASTPLSFLLLLLSAITPISAHTLFTNILVNGIDQGLGTCMRMPLYPNNATFPQPSITGPSMTCGFNGDTAVARTCPVQPGSTVTLQFRDHPDASAPGSIDPSHKGPCAAYLKKVDDATKNGTGSTDTATGSSDGWFRIFYSDYDQTAGKWCTETLIENNGLLSVEVPQTLPAGDYLLRGELLALHQADKTPPDPQFYVGCAQIWMNGSAETQQKLPSAADTVAIPGYVNLSMPAMTFNIWQTPMKLPYPGYGPPVYQDPAAATASVQASASSSATTKKRKRSTTSPSQAQQTSGLRPPSCILAVANWCGTEMPAYSTQQGCWNASTACYGQESACWRAAGPTGGAGCKVWEGKCKQIQDACKAGNYVGPPEQGKRLDQAAQKVQVPPVGGMFGVQRIGGVVGAGAGSGSGSSGSSVILSSSSAPVVAGYSSVAATSTASTSASASASASTSASAPASPPVYSEASVASTDTSASVNTVPASSTAAPISSLGPTTLTVVAIPLTSSSTAISTSSSSYSTQNAAATTPTSVANIESYESDTSKGSQSGHSSHNDHDHDHDNGSSSSHVSSHTSTTTLPSSPSSTTAVPWDTNAQFLAAAEVLSEAYASDGSGPSPFSLLDYSADSGSGGSGGGGGRHGRSWGGSLGRCGPDAGTAGGSCEESGKRDGQVGAAGKCAIGLCCSRSGFCGLGDGYCGSGCLEGFGVCA